MTDKIPVSLTSTICRSEDHLAAEIDNELVLMSLEKDCYYGLDVISTDIWQRLEKPVVVADICTDLLKEYEADAETINRDMLALLEKFAAEGLIKVEH